MKRFRKNFNHKLIFIAVVLLLLISVGYAALSTTLSINGTANISSNSWLVYFTNVQVTTGSVTATTVPTTSGTSTTTLTWAVNLEKPGDYYEFNVDVKNDGTIDAMIGSLSNTSLTTNQEKYLDYFVTYDDGVGIEQYDRLDAGEKETLKVRIEYKTDLTPEDLPSETSVVTLSYTLNYVQADDRNAKYRITEASLNIGKTVNYSTTMNGVTLDNWRVFYVDGDYTTLILSDYLPNAAIDTSQTGFSNLLKKRTYEIYVDFETSTRIQLLDAMRTKSNWKELLTGTIDGKNIDYSNTTDTNIWAMGAPTLDLYANSWNAIYPYDRIYIAQTPTVMSDGINGYYLGLEKNPTDDYLSNQEIRMTEGYNNTLYYPHQAAIDNCWGYWLTSAASYNVHYVMGVGYSGDVAANLYAGNNLAARPVVTLPSNILNK